MAKIRIVVVDDHEMVRHGLRLSLNLEPDMSVVAEARRGRDAVQIATSIRPDIVLLDVRLEDIDGPEVCRQVVAGCRRTSVIMLSSYLHDDVVLRCLLAGAKGYVIKDTELTELKGTIRSVYRGNTVLDPRITTQVVSSVIVDAASRRSRRMANAVAALSETDISIIRSLANGLTTKQIANRVKLSPHTVKDHVQKVSAIFGVRSRPGIVATAMRRGLI